MALGDEALEPLKKRAWEPAVIVVRPQVGWVVKWSKAGLVGELDTAPAAPTRLKTAVAAWLSERLIIGSSSAFSGR